MGVNEIKQEIDKFERSIEAKQQNLNKLRQRITDEVKFFVNPQLKENVEKEVKSNSEHTIELGREKLSVMKQRLVALMDNSDNLVEKVFANNDFWSHVNFGIGDDRYAYGIQEEAKRKIYKGIKIILGEAGKLLIDYDYVKPGVMYQWDSDTRRNFNFVDSTPEKTDLIYKGHLPIPKALSLLIEEYAKEIKALYDLYVKVSDLKRDLSEQEAVDLWDEV